MTLEDVEDVHGQGWSELESLKNLELVFEDAVRRLEEYYIGS